MLNNYNICRIKQHDYKKTCNMGCDMSAEPGLQAPTAGNQPTGKVAQ
jgi:hypothetical protein